ncbi:MAG: efflux RND transporter permease subunit [Tannerella sp.]|jgi:HAE1 family hydrophobic/amphiphilic exporter-1|nr:efflux RND transporter permease subunit [Tannerella sp.]
MKIINTSVKNPITTALCFVAIIIFGVFSYFNLAVDLLPQIESNAIMVMTSYPGASASDIENNVTKPIENVLNGTSDLKHISSSSRENVSIVNLEFEFGTDINIAMNDVRDKLEMVKSSLPDDVENPMIFKFGVDDILIMILSATTDQVSNGLYRILEDQVANPLARISGVGTVSVSGTPQREINVYCDPYKMEAYNISVESLSQTIAMENRNTPGGNVDFGSNTYNLRVQGEFTNAKQILDLVIKSAEGRTVRVRDVARVEDSMQERSQISSTNGQKGAMIVIQKQSGGNSVEISRTIRENLPLIQENLPSDITLGIIIDTSTNIQNIMSSLMTTILITMFIVMLVVFVFLGRFNTTIIVLVTIPVSLIGAFVYLFATGNTLNIISLSSLSLAIGMVVDNAIVVLENIMTHLKRGSKPKQAAIYATKEVGISVVAGTLTILAVFIPLTLVSGMTGVLFRQLGGIVSVIMFISMVSAVTLIPMMSSRMLSQKHEKSRLYIIFFTPIERGLDMLDLAYGRLLNWAVHNRKKVIAGAILVFAGSVMLFPLIRTEFFPTMDNARIGITLELPIGTHQSITENLAERVTEEFQEKYPEIDVINYTLGQADADNAFANMNDNGTHLISYNISLVSVEERKRGLTEICELMRVDLDMYTELKDYEVLAGGSAGVGGETGVDIEIYGYDFAATDAIARELSERLKETSQCSQTTISRGEYSAEVLVDFDREKLALNDLNVSMVSGYLRNRINGSVASSYREDGEEYDIRVRYAPEFRSSIEDVENILVYNSDGKGIYIRDLGKVTEKMMPPTIERKDRERMVTVTGIAAKGVALSEIVDESVNILDQMEIPLGITWGIGGAYEQQQETFSDIMVLMVLIVILVFIVMASQFESMKDPFVIMFTIPFALTGVLIGLTLTNTPLGIMAMIGLLILIGVVVKNGIVLIDYIKLCRERNLNITDAVVTAGKSRLRPVLMTTLTTVLGMVPMAIGIGEGSEMWRSMGITVAWGLSLSTVITLILIPVVYCVFAGKEENKQKKDPEQGFVLDFLAEP